MKSRVLIARYLLQKARLESRVYFCTNGDHKIANGRKMSWLCGACYRLESCFGKVKDRVQRFEHGQPMKNDEQLSDAETQKRLDKE